MATNYSKLNRTLSKLSLDSPKVIAARMQMFAMPGAMLSARDRTEFTRMHLEKQAAAIESCMSLWQSGTEVCQQFWTGLMLGQFTTGPSASSVANMARTALRPYQKRASANARRLRRRR